jgi:hypothetical protein
MHYRFVIIIERSPLFSVLLSYSLPNKEIDIKSEELDIAARSAAMSNSSLGRE